eukprot:365993-Chlamydomonas_euryale.AAC.10
MDPMHLASASPLQKCGWRRQEKLGCIQVAVKLVCSVGGAGEKKWLETQGALKLIRSVGCVTGGSRTQVVKPARSSLLGLPQALKTARSSGMPGPPQSLKPAWSTAALR